MKNGLFCSAGRNWFSIGSEGDVYLCNSLVYNPEFKIGNLITEDIKVPTDMGRCPVQRCHQVCDRHWSQKAIYKDDQQSDYQDIVNPEAYRGLKKPCSIIWAAQWACNYKCVYCTLPVDKEKVKPLQWVNAFDRFFNTNGFDGGVFHTNGGEPLFYDGIEQVFSYVASRGFKISLTTNLSSDVWNKVVHAAGPEKWGIINCSLHAVEPKFNWEMYAGRILALKALGYPVSINYVGHPSQIMLAPKYAEFAAAHKIPFSLIPMIGKYDGFDFSSIEKYPLAMREILKNLCPDQLKDDNRFEAGERVQS